MPVYLAWHGVDGDRAQELEVPAVIDAATCAAAGRAHLAWPATAAAAATELDQLARVLADAGVTVKRDGQDLVLPALAAPVTPPASAFA